MAQATSTGGMVAGCGGRAACRCAAASRAASKGDRYNRAWDAFDA